jgi:glycosyltransferase involved in cell wall biosynthesis
VTARQRVYVTNQSLAEHVGGTSSVTAWVLQALAPDLDVRLATPAATVDFARIDEMYGTCLARAGIGVHQLPVPGWARRVPAHMFKSVRLAASFRDPVLHGRDGGLVFNTANEVCFTGDAVHYVHCPIRHPRMIRELFSGPERLARLANNAAFRLVSGFDERRFRQARCLANSRWTAAALRRTYGIDAQVVYPPVTSSPAAPSPLADRAAGFVCLGRLAPEKRTHEAIAVVDALRDQGHDVHLHLVGTGNGRYAAGIAAAAQQRAHVTLHGHLPRRDLEALFARHRFGLHMMRNEHFGMAVAEMTAAGLLVLAHRSAGPMEILGALSPLLFTDVAQAVTVAAALLRSPARQEELMGGVLRVRAAFDPEAFMRAVRDAVGAPARVM